jgi:hypothetical protein
VTTAAAGAEPDLRFHERMRGWISLDAPGYNTALLAGRREGNSCALDLTVEIDDLDRFLHGSQYPGRLSGFVECPRLGGRLEVEDGTFDLFVRAPDARRRRMIYRLFTRDSDQRELTVSGFKLVEDDPNNDAWGDTSRLLVRVLAGHVPHWSEEDADPRTLATGVLFITPLRFLSSVLSMRGGRGRRLSAPARFQAAFVGGLLRVYGGRALPRAQFDFPAVRPGTTQFQGQAPGRWHELPGRPALERRILAFDAGDGCEINLHHIRARHDKPHRGPVLLVTGLAMRANSFYDTPSWPSLVDALVRDGYDVWVENWRTSIDLPAQDYTLDRAAVYDHPAAIRKIREETACERLDAVAHCMGSASLTMSVLAGLVPELRSVVSSAVSLHIDLDDRSRRRLRTLMPLTALMLRGADPQWAVRAPSPAAAGLARWARFVRRDYANPLTAATTYIYGGQPEALWQRDNLDARTLEWLAREFGYAPFSVFKQIRRCSDAGHLVPVEELPELRRDLVSACPPDGTRFTFLAGAENRFFLPSGQRKTYEHFNELQPGRHAFSELKGCSHVDALVGRRAPTHVFPRIRAALSEQGDGGS